MSNRWILYTLRDCGGPVVFLSTVCFVVGVTFLVASAQALGWVMILSGIAALTTLLFMGYRSFHQPHFPLLLALCRRHRH